MAAKANYAVVCSDEEDKIDYTSKYDDTEDPEDNESDEATDSAVENVVDANKMDRDRAALIHTICQWPSAPQPSY